MEVRPNGMCNVRARRHFGRVVPGCERDGLRVWPGAPDDVDGVRREKRSYPSCELLTTCGITTKPNSFIQSNF